MIPEYNTNLAADFAMSNNVVDAEPHDRGVYLYLTDAGYGFSNIREDYDFYVADCFTMEQIGPDHRHYRDGAAFFLNIITADAGTTPLADDVV